MPRRQKPKKRKREVGALLFGTKPRALWGNAGKKLRVAYQSQRARIAEKKRFHTELRQLRSRAQVVERNMQHAVETGKNKNVAVVQAIIKEIEATRHACLRLARKCKNFGEKSFAQALLERAAGMAELVEYGKYQLRQLKREQAYKNN